MDLELELENYEGRPADQLMQLLQDLLENGSNVEKVREREALSRDRHLDVFFGDKKFQLTISEV